MVGDHQMDVPNPEGLNGHVTSSAQRRADSLGSVVTSGPLPIWTVLRQSPSLPASFPMAIGAFVRI
jgi:hypothetical protein